MRDMTDMREITQTRIDLESTAETQRMGEKIILDIPGINPGRNLDRDLGLHLTRILNRDPILARCRLLTINQMEKE